MSQINTRIVLRNDTKANWEKVKDTATLMVGEVGVETDTGLFKIGKEKTAGVLYTWAELPYANDLTGVTNNVKVEATLEALGNGAVVGDMGIVKAPLYEGATQYTYTAYVWNGTAWAAMDGNYSAENVYFDADITLAGSYTAVGNVTKESAAATGTLEAKGKNLEQVMQSIFTKELYPATGSNRNLPSLAISGLSDATGEVGVTYTLPTATLTVSDVGAYTYGPATGITFAVNNLTLAQGAVSGATNKATNSAKAFTTNDTLTLTATVPSGTSSVFTDSAITYKFNASGTYTDGVSPITNLGNALDTGTDSSKWTYRIKSGTATATEKSAKRTGYRKPFWCYRQDILDIAGLKTNTNASDIIRAFDTDNAFTGTEGSKVCGDSGTTTKGLPGTFNIPASANAKQVLFCAKASSYSTLVAKDAAAQNSTVSFTKVASGVSVKGANGYSATAYDIWYATFPDGLAANMELVLTWS